MENNTAKRGFASMDSEKQKAIARKGGLAHSKEHMTRIGKLGAQKRKENSQEKVMPQGMISPEGSKERTQNF